jgi:head-tail adaptor
VIPLNLLTQTVTWQKAGSTTDARGDTVLSWASPTSSTITAWIERQGGTESDDETRNVRVTSALLITNETGIGARDRIVWAGQIWTVEGKPRIVPTPLGNHHLEVGIQLVEG